MSSPTAGDGGTSPWSWDASLYAGSAEYYATGRIAYPTELADVLVAEVPLDGSGRLLDVGCGPGSLTLLLAPHVAEAIGVDADADMLTVAARRAAQQQIANVTWRHLRAEDLPDDLPPVQFVTFAQSFHWMDRPRVAATVRALVTPGGVLIHVHATTHEGVETQLELPHPGPPRAAVADLVRRYLGDETRAGQGLRPTGNLGGEEEIYRAAGWTAPQRLEVAGRVVERTVDQVAASVHSLSWSAPHLFGDRWPAFDAELRHMLAEASPDGRFSEQMRSIAIDIWR
ncbi:MAG: class I SAM-dependent methyltransferase [bacterium]